MRSLIIEWGRTGWGHDKGPPSSLMCGFVRFFWLNYGVLGAMRTYEEALAAAQETIVRLRGQKKTGDAE